MSFGNEYESPDLLTDRMYGAPTEFPHVYVNATPGGRSPSSDRVNEFADALVLTIANPSILDIIGGARFRRRPTRLYERRPGQIRIWDSPLADFLYIWKCQVRRHRNMPRMRRARIETVPPQFNPPYLFAEIKQPRVPRGLLRRKSKPVESPPLQVVLVQSDVPWSRAQARALRGLLPRRAGHPVMFIFPGAAPVKTGTGVYLERDSIRIIPLITKDGGTTWVPRGT